MKIMLDAGHGYDTPGKRSPDGLREYEFNRAVASYAKALLETYKNVTVYFAHSDQRDVPLKERTDTANRLQVDAYVAIHGNAFGSAWNDAGGIETYVYPTSPNEAVELARKIQKHLVMKTGLRNRGVKTANFHVLRETHMTAVLAECGFMTNKEELALMRSDAYRHKCAEAIVTGIAEQYQLVKKVGSSAKSPSKGIKASKADQSAAPSSSTTRGSKKASPPAKTPDSSSSKVPAVPSSKAPAAPPAKTTSASQAVLHRVQVGAFEEKQHAEELVSRLKADGYDAYIESEPKK